MPLRGCSIGEIANADWELNSPSHTRREMDETMSPREGLLRNARRADLRLFRDAYSVSSESTTKSGTEM